MRIGEIAEKSGLSAHTLRYYEKAGLFKSSGRSESNYRVYTQNDLETALFIKRARNIGFSVEEVGTFLSIRSDLPAHVCAEAKQLADEKIETVSHQIAELEKVLTALRRMSDACCGGSTSAEYCSIIDALEREDV